MSIATSSAPGAAPNPNAKAVDALTGAFAELARYDNTNTNQIVLVDGALSAAKLADAVKRAVRAFPLLQVGYPPAREAWRDIGMECCALQVHRWDGRFDFADAPFRAMLMTLNECNRLDWKLRAPFQVYLILGRDDATSCVYLSSAHAVADAHSDCQLLERIMDEYACADADAGAPQRTYGFESLQRIRPAWYSPRARVNRLARAVMSIAVDLFRRDRSFASRPSRRVATPAPEIDFYHSVIDDDLEHTLKRIAKLKGVTLNTLLTAALVRLIERHGTGRGPVRLTCAISLRFMLGSHYIDTFRNYLVATGLRFPVGLPDASLVARVHGAVQRARKPGSLRLELGRLELLVMLLKIPALYPLTRAIGRRTQGTNVCFSNPGLIRAHMTKFDACVEGTAGARSPSRYIGFGCLIAPYDVIFYTPTVNGRLQFDAVFRRSAFDDFSSQFVGPYCAELRHLLTNLDSAEPATCEAAPRPSHTEPA